MCAEVQILFLHKKQDDSVISLQRFKLLGLGSVSNVAPFYIYNLNLPQKKLFVMNFLKQFFED